ncbi:LysR family transcriptional regulator [Pollutimonas bauzanensis]|uniref:DNA-binding transcriptional regulator, LysR family n=1 Tax=Pollutimonas bauzanensis TaxID=658167 RepID=A0A1M5Z8L2_9BURK|nr:LysR family transcriptional regulator [Pollutimonas bauzanensis]SHI20567.1 DNA-binding transcriptional regulator, LysR family [Pollutimonas bauzanensis]
MNIRRSDLPLLISLDALLEERNVTRAAKRLNISQPALSTQLGRLRDMFGDPLLVPSEAGRGMSPTDRALAIQPRLHQALLDLQGAVASREGFQPRNAQRDFVVAVNDNVFTLVGLAVAQSVWAHQAPGIRLSFIAPVEANLTYRMERGEIDLYVGLTQQVPEALKVRFLLKDEFRLAQRKGHPRGTENPDIEEYCSLAHVMVSQEGKFKSGVDDALEILKRKRHVALTVSGYNQIPLVLGETNCVATLPSRLLRRYAAGLDVLSLPFHLSAFDVAMAWHPRSHEDPAHQWLREHFIRAADQSPNPEPARMA